MRKLWFILVIVLSLFLIPACKGCDDSTGPTSSDDGDDGDPTYELTAEVVNTSYVEVTSEKEVDYIQWTLRGEPQRKPTDDSGHYASINLFNWDFVGYGNTYEVTIQAYNEENGSLVAAYDEPLVMDVTISDASGADGLSAEMVADNLLGVTSDIAVDYIEVTMNGYTEQKATDSSNQYAEFNVFDCFDVIYGDTYQTTVQAYNEENGELVAVYSEPLVVSITI